MKMLRQPYVGVTLGYMILTFALLWPLWPQMGSAIAGGPVADVDGWQNVWNLWWMHWALSHAQNPFFTTYQYYPQGVSLALQPFNPSNGLLALPITALFGPIAGYNVVVALACVLSGIFAYALALAVSGDRLGAFVAGCAFAAAPFHQTKIWDGQLELIATQWLAAYALFLWRSISGGLRRDVVLAGISLALIGYTSWYYLLFIGVFSLIVALAALGWSAERRQLLLRLVGIAALGGTLLAPALLASLAASGGVQRSINLANPFDPIVLRSANLLDPFLPSYLHPLWGEMAWNLGRAWHPYTMGWNLALGYAALLLAAIGVARHWTRARLWLLPALVSLLLALGPALNIGTTRLDLPMPYHLLLLVPGASLGQRPSHFLVITLLCMVPLIGLGIAALRQYRLGQIVAAGLSLLLLIEFLPPRWNLIAANAPTYYQQLRGGDGAVLDLPIFFASNESSLPLKAQMLHQRPMLGGFVSRAPDYPFPFTVPYLRQLARFTPEPERLLRQPDDGLHALRGYGIRDIVIHRERLSPEQAAGLSRALATALPDLTPVYSDTALLAYRLPEVPPRSYASPELGWYPEECNAEDCWRWMGDAATLLLTNPTTEPRPLQLLLTLRSFNQPRELQLALGDAPLGQWQIDVAPRTVALWLLLPPGSHPLRLSAPAELEREGGRGLSLALEAAYLDDRGP